MSTYHNHPKSIRVMVEFVSFIFPCLSQQLHHKSKVYMEVKVLREVKGEKYVVKRLLECLISYYIIIISLNNCNSIFPTSIGMSKSTFLAEFHRRAVYHLSQKWFFIWLINYHTNWKWLLFSLKYSFLYTKWK